MAKIKVGDKAGNYDINVLDLNLKVLTDTKYKDYSWESHKNGTQTLTMAQSKQNYMEINGEFNLKAFSTKDIAKVVREVTSLSVYEDGKLSYSIGDLDLTSRDVASNKAFGAFIDSMPYEVTGNNSDNTIAAAGRNDDISGLGGNDSLYGLSGLDELRGGAGKDGLWGGNQDDELYGDAGDDKLFGDDGNDSLEGGADNDKLYGGDGRDKLEGGNGADTYYWGKGDTVIETRNGGNDNIISSDTVDLSNSANVENIVLIGSDDIDATGNSSDNIITGNRGENILRGKDGEDRLDGAAGDDFLYGGEDSDKFIFAKNYDHDTIVGFDATGKDHDIIDLSNYDLKFKELELTKLSKDSLEVSFGRGDVLEIDDVNLRDIDASDFRL